MTSWELPIWGKQIIARAQIPSEVDLISSVFECLSRKTAEDSNVMVVWNTGGKQNKTKQNSPRKLTVHYQLLLWVEVFPAQDIVVMKKRKIVVEINPPSKVWASLKRGSASHRVHALRRNLEPVDSVIQVDLASELCSKRSWKTWG